MRHCKFSGHSGLSCEIDNKRKLGNVQIFGNVFIDILNNPWVKEGVTIEIKIYFELNDIGHTKDLNLQDEAKAA